MKPKPSVMSRTYSSCSYVALATFPSEFAHTIQIMAMCDAFARAGLNTRLHATRAPAFSGDDDTLRALYGVCTPFEVVWHPHGLKGNLGPRFRMAAVAWDAVRAGDLVFTRHVIAAVSAALAGGHAVLELHSPALPRTERALLRLIRATPNVTFVAISRRLADIIATRYGVDRARIHVAHDACRLAPDCSEHTDGSPADRLKAVYVGSFYPGRGLDTIWRLAERLPHVDFIAVGGNRSQTGIAGDPPQNLDLRPRVEHPKVAGILREADILLMPYGRLVTVNGEGDNGEFCSPLKLFEYLAAGKAIASTRTPSIAEVLIDNENALLVEAEDLDGWEVAVRRLAEDPQLRERLGRAAAVSAQSFTWDGRVAGILEAAS